MRRLWALYWIAAIMMLGGLIGMGVMGAGALGAAARCQCPYESRSDARHGVSSCPQAIADAVGGQGVELQDLYDLEARMLWAEERRRAWEELARRHQGASAIACEQLAEAATQREVR